MKTIIKLIMFCVLFSGFSNLAKAQEVENPQEELIENEWYLIKVVIDEEEHLFNTNEEIEQVVLSFDTDSDEEEVYLFSPALCESVEWSMYFVEENDFEAEEDINWALTWCSNGDNIYYDNFYYFGFWKAQEDPSFHYTIIETDEMKKLIINNENGDQAFYQEVTYMSVKDQEKSNLTLYPNPAKDHLYIENLTENVQLEIYDLSGRKLLSQEINNSTESVNVSQLSEGIYFYGLSQNGKKIKTGKLVKRGNW